MKLPERVRGIIEARGAEADFGSLKRAAALLSETYRAGHATRHLRLSAGERVAAYVVTRMPATYAASYAALAEVRRRLETSPATLLDAGGGTGAAALAAREIFPCLERVTILEADPDLAAAGREFLPEAEWRIEDFTRAPQAHDLVVAAYALSEAPRPEEAAWRLWQAANAAFLAVEPGTPAGFALIRRIRDRLLAAGAHMLAPCPGSAECPVGAGDWCHFAARVERSGLHRRLKDAALGYEDEKFSYVALAKAEARPAGYRIIRHPRRQPGLVTLQLCHGGAISTTRVPRSDRESYRAARKAAWGDEWR